MGDKTVKKAKEDKVSRSGEMYYMDIFYARYLIYREGNNYSAIEKKQREQLSRSGEPGSQAVLDRRLLKECCEGVKYGKKDQGRDEDENGTALPMMSKNFVNAFCAFFQVEKEDICFSDKDIDKEFPVSEKTSVRWQKKRRELKEKLGERIRKEEEEAKLAEQKKAQTGPGLETARLTEVLTEVLKLCDIGYLSRIHEYLAELLRPHTRRFWKEMEMRLKGLNWYLGYPEAIEAGRVETGSVWDYPVRDEFGFQKNEPLDKEILLSLAERQGISGFRALSEALSKAFPSEPKQVVYRQRLTELVKGESGSPQKKRIAECMGELLHAGWKDMKGEGCRFWSEQAGVAVWEDAEERMRQAVQALRPEDWNTAEEIFLALKNVIRFSLCCHEPERNRELLEELGRRLDNKAKVMADGKKSLTDAACAQCIQELKEEYGLFAELSYKLLLNGMNVELLVDEAFERELGDRYRTAAKESIREICREQTCTDEEQEKLKEYVLQKMKRDKREEVRDGFQDVWLQTVEKQVCPNPWFCDSKLTVAWIYYEDSDNADVLEDLIEVRIQLPKELNEALEPGEIIAELPYEKGAKLNEAVSLNWSVICETMDDSFGQDLEGWDAELYEEWKENVEVTCEKVFYRDWEPYSVDNEEIDRLIADENFGNRYQFYVEIGRMSLRTSDPELALDEKECYEEGIHLLRRAERTREKAKGKT